MNPRRYLETLWRRQSNWLLLLKPLEWFYRLCCVLRKQAYSRNWLSSYRSSLPVIVVGNIALGGTGKTPVVLALVELLTKAGFRPGIVSRGYGGDVGHQPLLVQADTSAAACGDEPLLLYRRSGRPCCVSPDRAQAVATLEQETDCDVVVCDDGLQHYALQRDMEIALDDQAVGAGGGDSHANANANACLPCGPLREPRRRLHEVDWVLTRGESAGLRFSLEPVAWVHLRSGVETRLDQPPPGKTVHVVTGIANPTGFYATLRGLGLEFTSTVFADHHAYRKSDLESIMADCILMTEKDAVKCAGFADSRTWFLRVNASLPEEFQQDLVGRLREVQEVS